MKSDRKQRYAIKAAVRVENEKRCNPPLKEKELEKAVFPALKRDWQVNSPYYNNFNAMLRLCP